MPYYSELGIYTPSSSYTSPLLKGPYSSHSSILASNILPPSSKQFSRTNFRSFKPHLTTISESNLGAPLRRISSPKVLYHTSPKVRVPRPVKINTSDIDVSLNRYRNNVQPQTKPQKNISADEPSNVQKESSPVIEKEAKPNTEIRRDRATIRLQTIHKDTLEKEIGQIRSWRDNFKADELVTEAKHRRKSPGEILKEKFLIRSKSKENVPVLEPPKLPRKLSVKKSPSFKDICDVITSDQAVEDLNPGQPFEVRRRQSRQVSHDDVIKEIQRSSSTLSVEEVEILDALLQAENEVGLYEEPPVIDEQPKTTRRRKITKKKSSENLNNHKEAEATINNSADDELSDCPPQESTPKLTHSSSDKHVADSSKSHSRLRKDSSLKDMVKDISQVEIEMIPVKQKPIITSHIGTIEETVKTNLKAVVEDLEVEESPKPQEVKEKKFRFNVTVQEFPIKKKINFPRCQLNKDNYSTSQVPNAQMPVLTSILKKRTYKCAGQIAGNGQVRTKKKIERSLSEVQVRQKEDNVVKKSGSNDSVHSNFTVMVNKANSEEHLVDSPRGSGKLKIIAIESSLDESGKPDTTNKTFLGEGKIKQLTPKLERKIIIEEDSSKTVALWKSTKKELRPDSFLSKRELVKKPEAPLNLNAKATVKDPTDTVEGISKIEPLQKANDTVKIVDENSKKEKPDAPLNFNAKATVKDPIDKVEGISKIEPLQKAIIETVKIVDENNKKGVLDSKLKLEETSAKEIVLPLNTDLKTEDNVIKESENSEIETLDLTATDVKDIVNDVSENQASAPKTNQVIGNDKLKEPLIKNDEKCENIESKVHKDDSKESNFWENRDDEKYERPKLDKFKLELKAPNEFFLNEIHDSHNEPPGAQPETPEEKERRMISKRSLIQKANKSDPDLEVFEPPTPPPPHPVKEPSPEPSFVPLQSNRLSQWMHPWKKPEQLAECPVEIFAKPKFIRARHIPRRWKQNVVEDSDSEDSTTSDEDSSGESGEEDIEGEEEIRAQSKVGASTSSNDSGFDSGRAKDKECDVNCHKKCEKLMANLCGINQKLVVEAIEKVRKGSIDSRDSPGNTLNPASNPAFALDFNDLPEELCQSSTYQGFQKSGRITPPATTIPRFRKYCVDDFNFLKVLGKGSFGKVLLAELKGTEYYYAIKCLKKDVVLEDDDVECTLIERKVLALGTKHPYLCHLLCTFQTESHLFFVMEYLNGGDLMFHIQAERRFSEARARFYGAEIVSGLKFLHNKGIVYRDLKLDNILLDFDGHVRIADFGMCKLQIFLDRMADTFCGTPDYMAPEIIKGQHYNQCVDWWSFGVLLYEMLLGQSPFSGSDEDELFWSICNEKPVIPRFLSAEAGSVIVQFLEKDANKRLGNRFSPHGDIQDHAFFKPIDWHALEARQLESPFKPNLQHPLDTQYFDKTFTTEKAKLTPIETGILQSMDQTQFQGFSYTNPNATDK